jgi:hypothetical protein
MKPGQTEFKTQQQQQQQQQRQWRLFAVVAISLAGCFCIAAVNSRIQAAREALVCRSSSESASCGPCALEELVWQRTMLWFTKTW